MERVSLEIEYKILKAQLEREINAFELLKTQHQKRVMDLSAKITNKWIELRNSKTEAT